EPHANAAAAFKRKSVAVSLFHFSPFFNFGRGQSQKETDLDKNPSKPHTYIVGNAASHRQFDVPAFEAFQTSFQTSQTAGFETHASAAIGFQTPPPAGFQME